jgi:hypothetical protein
VKLDRRTVVLAVVATALGAAAVAATFVNHRSGAESRQRKAVAAYIDAVNLIQNQMHIQLARVAFAYRDLATHSVRPTRAPAELAAAAATLVELDRKLVATPAPQEAKRLRALLIKLVAQQAALTREVQALSAFSPRFNALGAQLRAAGSRLNEAVRAAPAPKPRSLRGTRAQVAAAERAFRAQQDAAARRQANAIDAYVHAVAGIVAALHALTVPPVVSPLYVAQVRSLRNVLANGQQLSAELRTPNRAHAAERIRAFILAGRAAGTVAVQRAQIAAIEAYNRRSRAVGTVASAVQSEVRRLGRVLP